MVDVPEVPPVTMTRKATRPASIATAVTSERATMVAVAAVTMTMIRPVSTVRATTRKTIERASEATAMMKRMIEQASEVAAMTTTMAKEADTAEVLAEAEAQVRPEVPVVAEAAVIVRVEAAVVVRASRRMKMPSSAVTTVISSSKSDIIFKLGGGRVESVLFELFYRFVVHSISCVANLPCNCGFGAGLRNKTSRLYNRITYVCGMVLVSQINGMLSPHQTC